VASFASVEDLEAVLGSSFDDPSEAAKAQTVLDLAASMIQDEAKQTISLVTDDVVELRGTWSHLLRLPERPVVDVTAVRIRNGSVFSAEVPLQVDVDYRWDRMGQLRRVSYITGRLLAPASGYWGGDMAVVDVTYSHGYAVVPDRVRTLCVGIAARVVSNPRGVRESIGPYSVQYDRAIPHFELTEAERRVARRFGLSA
jgi:hypothetical protein